MSTPNAAPAELTQLAEWNHLAQTVLRVTDTAQAHPAVSPQTAAWLQKQGLALCHGAAPMPACLADLGLWSLKAAEDFRTAAGTAALAQVAQNPVSYVMSDEGAKKFLGLAMDALPGIGNSGLTGLVALGSEGTHLLGNTLDARLAGNAVLQAVESWPETHHNPWPFNHEAALKVEQDAFGQMRMILSGGSS